MIFELNNNFTRSSAYDPCPIHKEPARILSPLPSPAVQTRRRIGKSANRQSWVPFIFKTPLLSKKRLRLLEYFFSDVKRLSDVRYNARKPFN